MTYEEIMGSFGVGLLLLAYFLNVFRQIRTDGPAYCLLNIAGAAIACYSSWLIHYFPFVILEGAWTLVSVWALTKSR
jgi:hypothetical protein